MTIQYKPQGTCSKQMKVKVDQGVIDTVEILGGCSGNLQGIAKLVQGMRAEEAIARMEGIRCGPKATSCPDQLAKALRIALKEEAKGEAR